MSTLTTRMRKICVTIIALATPFLASSKSGDVYDFIEIACTITIDSEGGSDVIYMRGNSFALKVFDRNGKITSEWGMREISWSDDEVKIRVQSESTDARRAEANLDRETGKWIYREFDSKSNRVTYSEKGLCSPGKAPDFKKKF